MSFDTLAPVYRGMEAVLAGNILQRCRETFLPRMTACRRALILGEGPGRFLSALLRANPGIEATCIERSPRMIGQARKNLARLGLDLNRVEFINADVRTWAPLRNGYDLVATHFFLDCFKQDELESLIVKTSAAATETATWVVSDFCLPDRGWRRVRAKLVLASMYAFFRVVAGLSAKSLTPPDPFLCGAGFRLAGRHHFNHGLVQSDLWLR